LIEDELACEVDDELRKKAERKQRNKNLVKNLGGLRMRKN
jgi:hypothetical protein